MEGLKKHFVHNGVEKLVLDTRLIFEGASKMLPKGACVWTQNNL